MSTRRFALANYRLRVVGLALGFVSLCVPFHDVQAPWWAWIGCAFHGFVWPHIAHFRSIRTSDWQKAESTNLLLDHLAGGLWIAAAGLNLLPCALMLSMMVMDSMICGGLALAGRGLAAHTAGTGLGMLMLWGAHWAPYTTPAGVLACLPLLLLHPAAVGFMAYQALGRLRCQRSEMEELSQRDPLSGLHNRRYFDQRMREEFIRHRRIGRDASLVMIDIDHFKKVNDTRGHAAGDEAIQRFARLLQICMREIDVTCRYGGEEFCVLMPDTSQAQATEAVQRFRAQLRVKPIMDGMVLTASFGIAGLTASTESVDTWVRQADELLYRAKHSGRNAIVASGTDEQTGH